MVRICIASKNPVKIKCTKNAFEKVYPDSEIDIIGMNAPSGVSDQPMTDRETLLGAKNRAQYIRKSCPEAQFHVGIEGGVQDDNGMQAFAWVYIIEGERIGKAKTAIFYLPDQIRKLVIEGMELGHADDQVFGRNNSKQKDGAIGILTQGLIDRAEYYEPAVVMALIPFVNSDMYH